MTHMKEHYSLKYPCKICEYQTNDENELKTHINKEHAQIRYMFECDICDCNLNNAVTLTAHKREVHMPIFVGQECNYQTDREGTLQIHTKKEHDYKNFSLYSLWRELGKCGQPAGSHPQQILHPVRHVC